MAYKIVIRSAIYRSEKIIAVSNFTKKDILSVYKNIPENKVVVTYEGCDNQVDKLPKNDEEVLQFYGIMKPYIIYVGNVYPHKNPERLVLAFKEVLEHKKYIALVFVGGEDYFYMRLKKFVAEKGIKNVIFAGFVLDGEMNVLLRNSQAYVRPSLYEGFELPPLEACSRACRCCSNMAAPGFWATALYISMEKTLLIFATVF